MSLAELLNSRFKASPRGQWFERADAEAVQLALGKPPHSLHGREQLPDRVVALPAITHLRDIVLEVAATSDALIEVRGTP